MDSPVSNIRSRNFSERARGTLSCIFYLLDLRFMLIQGCNPSRSSRLNRLRPAWFHVYSRFHSKRRGYRHPVVSSETPSLYSFTTGPWAGLDQGQSRNKKFESKKDANICGSTCCPTCTLATPFSSVRLTSKSDRTIRSSVIIKLRFLHLSVHIFPRGLPQSSLNERSPDVEHFLFDWDRTWILLRQNTKSKMQLAFIALYVLGHQCWIVWISPILRQRSTWSLTSCTRCHVITHCIYERITLTAITFVFSKAQY